jgi:hypothetical protein
MSIVLPALAIAFSAFCVWLAVRIVNLRQKPGLAFRIIATSVVLALAYVGSYSAIIRPVKLYGMGHIITLRSAHWGPFANRIGSGGHERFWLDFFSPIWELDRWLRPNVWPDPQPLLPPSHHQSMPPAGGGFSGSIGNWTSTVNESDEARK